MSGTAREVLAASEQLTKQTVAAMVDGKVFDLHTALPTAYTKLTPIESHQDTALSIIRHSTAHVMADAVQRLFPGTKVAFGPAIENVFYYDYSRPNGSFSE